MVHTDDLYNLSNCNVSLNSMIHNSSFIRKTLCHIATDVESIKWDSENEKWNYVNSFAAGGGHLDICKYSILLGATDFNYSLINAARAGHLDICKYLISQDTSGTFNATNFNWALDYAAYGGHLELCKYFVSIGTNKYNRAIDNAAYGGHKDVEIYLINQKNMN